MHQFAIKRSLYNDGGDGEKDVFQFGTISAKKFLDDKLNSKSGYDFDNKIKYLGEFENYSLREEIQKGKHKSIKVLRICQPYIEVYKGFKNTQKEYLSDEFDEGRLKIKDKKTGKVYQKKFKALFFNRKIGNVIYIESITLRPREYSPLESIEKQKKCSKELDITTFCYGGHDRITLEERNMEKILNIVNLPRDIWDSFMLKKYKEQQSGYKFQALVKDMTSSIDNSSRNGRVLTIDGKKDEVLYNGIGIFHKVIIENCVGECDIRDVDVKKEITIRNSNITTLKTKGAEIFELSDSKIDNIDNITRYKNISFTRCKDVKLKNKTLSNIEINNSYAEIENIRCNELKISAIKKGIIRNISITNLAQFDNVVIGEEYNIEGNIDIKEGRNVMKGFYSPQNASRIEIRNLIQGTILEPLVFVIKGCYTKLTIEEHVNNVELYIDSDDNYDNEAYISINAVNTQGVYKDEEDKIKKMLKRKNIKIIRSGNCKKIIYFNGKKNEKIGENTFNY